MTSFPHAEFSLQPSTCRNSTYDKECITDNEIDNKLFERQIGMWVNRMRFDQLEYSKDSPVYKESKIEFFHVPSLQEKRLFSIKESILQREDSLLMSIETLTGIEEEFFDFVEQP